VIDGHPRSLRVVLIKGYNIIYLFLSGV